jgi:hypothetical protein
MKLIKVAKIVNASLKEEVAVLQRNGIVIKNSPMTKLNEAMIKELAVAFKIDLIKIKIESKILKNKRIELPISKNIMKENCLNRQIQKQSESQIFSVDVLQNSICNIQEMTSLDMLLLEDVDIIKPQKATKIKSKKYNVEQNQNTHMDAFQKLKTIQNTICSKKSFTNHRDAQNEINNIKKHSSRSKIPMRAYYCPKCKYYHLTSISSANTKRK